MIIKIKMRAKGNYIINENRYYASFPGTRTHHVETIAGKVEVSAFPTSALGGIEQYPGQSVVKLADTESVGAIICREGPPLEVLGRRNQ